MVAEHICCCEEERPSTGLQLEADDFKPPDVESQHSGSSGPQIEPGCRSANVAARIVTDMRLIQPEILRSTSARVVLRHLGHILRVHGVSGMEFLSSNSCKVIDQFWSHSWHGNAWHKVLLLLVLYNGLAAVVVGTLGALAVLPLILAGVLPPFQDGRSAGGWCVLSGSLAAGLTFIFWLPGKKIFLDRVCIHQTNGDLKLAGILSIGAFLKHSRSMLVCWDETYFNRLWCVLELAAFLKSHSGREIPLLIRPTFLGPCCVAVFGATAASMLMIRSQQQTMYLIANPVSAAVTFAIAFGLLGAVAAGALRDFFAKLAVLKEQLPQFRLQDTDCHCCAAGHVTERGEPITCDREVVEECIRSWFGSTEEFERSVRTKVLAEVEKQLGYYLFPYHVLLGCTVPITWAHFDALAFAIRDSNWDALVLRILYVTSRWLGELPIFFVCACPIMWKLRHRQTMRHADVAVNILCMWLPLPVYYGMYVGGAFLRTTWGTLGQGLMLVMVLLASLVLWQPWSTWTPILLWSMRRNGESRQTAAASSKEEADEVQEEVRHTMAVIPP